MSGRMYKGMHIVCTDNECKVYKSLLLDTCRIFVKAFDTIAAAQEYIDKIRP